MQMNREDRMACIASYFPWFPLPDGFTDVLTPEQLHFANPNVVLNVAYANGTGHNVSINELGQHYGYPTMQQNKTTAARIVYMHPSGSVITHPNKGIVSGPVHPFTQIATVLSYVLYVNERLMRAGMPLMYVRNFEKPVNQVVTASMPVERLEDRLMSVIYDDRRTSVTMRDCFPATFISFVVPLLDIRVTIRIFDKGSVCINGVPDLHVAYFIAASFCNTLYAYLVLNMPLPVDRSARSKFVPAPLNFEEMATLGARSDDEEEPAVKEKVQRPRKKRAVAAEPVKNAVASRHSIMDMFRLGDGRTPLDDPDAIALLLAQVDEPQEKGFFDS